ncbi:uncharacterized protein VTP21DRAFT_5441 [Calcarisporiella thermophila]|uniref:uncharacterized protein n=1 Tax=Calcarisporiella thermophila TaxID=911321 RepID=UPI0037444D35
MPAVHALRPKKGRVVVQLSRNAAAISKDQSPRCQWEEPFRNACLIFLLLCAILPGRAFVLLFAHSCNPPEEVVGPNYKTILIHITSNT